MDPNAALINIIEAIDNESRIDACDALDDLSRWIASGGFLPARIATILAHALKGA